MKEEIIANGLEPKIIIFSPVRVVHTILKEFLHNIKMQKIKNYQMEFWFYDDNDDTKSTNLLENFKPTGSSKKRILPGLNLPPTNYDIDENTHIWKSESISRIINIKNYALTEFLKSKADAVFLIDSDICLHPKTLEHLIMLNLPIVSEVFWTKWTPNGLYMPNVWDYDGYSYKSAQSLLQLRIPGQYQVGGLGACTLIKRQVIESGVSFSLIDNVSFWGEDRHFCIRARSNNFGLFADTVFPPFHIYRESLLDDAKKWSNTLHSRDYFMHFLDKGWENNVIGGFDKH